MTEDEEQRAGVQIRLENDSIEVAPGNAESTAFTIKNLGTKVEQFRLNVTGPEWLLVEPDTVSVFPGQEATGTVQAAPPRMPTSAVGISPFQLTVTSALHSHVSGSVAGRVDIAPFYELAAQLTPTTTRGRKRTVHRIILDNRGNVPLRIPLSPADVADGLRLDLPPFAEVAPGRVNEVPVTVQAGRRWFGRPEPRTFSVTAEGPKPLAPARLQGTRIVVPFFPRWVPVAGAGVLAATVAVAAIARAQMKKPHPASPVTATSSARPSASQAPSASTAASPSANSSSASPAATSVQVMDVAGDSLDQAKANLTQQGLKPAPEAIYGTSNGGDVVRTIPAAGQSVPAGSSIRVLVSTPTYDMVSMAPSASWTTTSLTPPSPTISRSFGGKPGDAQGAVLSLSSVPLEDETMAGNALETNPPVIITGVIQGQYQLPAAILTKEDFSSDLGFLRGTGGEIAYRIQAKWPTGNSKTVTIGTHGPGTGQMAPLHFDLSQYAGATQITLEVEALDAQAAQDDVVWVGPRVEAADAPAEPGRLPAPPSSLSPSP